jgi:hypothetical protein
MNSTVSFKPFLRFSHSGDIIEYFESDNKEGYSLNPQEISIRKYKAMLWKAVKDILEIAGYKVAAIEQELFQHSISHMGNAFTWSGWK